MHSSANFITSLYLELYLIPAPTIITEYFEDPINFVLGNEWNAGNLSYHLKSRPVWDGNVDKNKLETYNKFICIDEICVGNK